MAKMTYHSEDGFYDPSYGYAPEPTTPSIVRILVDAPLLRAFTRTEGTYNRQDPTQWIRWSGKGWLAPLVLSDVTWGIEVMWHGRRMAYVDMDNRSWKLRPISWLFGALEGAYRDKEMRSEPNPMGSLRDYE